MQESIMERLWSTSHLSGGNASYVEGLYDTYLHDPNSVPEQWREYFDQLPRVEGVVTQDTPHSAIREQFAQLAKSHSRSGSSTTASASSIEHERKQVKVLQLISSYRFRGHQRAQLDPLGLMEREAVLDLELSYHGLTEADLDTSFQTGTMFIGKNEAPLREIVEALEQTYCGHIGPEIMHITNLAEKQWLQQRLESVRSKPTYSPEQQMTVLERLTAAEGLERHLDSKYPGTKRFGLEGGESFIPLVDAVVKRSGSYGAKEIVLGMAHRGRLNTLVNVFGKSPAELFGEFEGKRSSDLSGDVKYHQGFSSNVMTPGGEVHLAMAFNPSHLEIVSPVIEGSVRARQDRRDDTEGQLVLPISIHGDSAFSGQGVVMETFQMSQTRAYKTGGTIHVVINNQVGFTTAKPEDTRSSEYCTDVAKMVSAPIFHVNGDDPEAVLHVTQVAVDYRMQFKRDVVINLVCYRRRGHNEADEPSGTQPLMYQKIAKHPTTRTIYGKKLVAEGLITAEEDKKLSDDYRDALDNGQHVANALVKEPNKALFVDWTPYLGHEWTAEYDTSVEMKKLQELAGKMCEVPEGFQMQRQVSKIYEDRRKMQAGAMAINWGFAEVLAYATLIDADLPIRITGQDVGRGTFSHRHAVLHDFNDGRVFVPLQNMKPNQRKFIIHDSFLSEEAVLAFEYGYATTKPDALVIWEAQFGDFANGAQVVIDQFISSGETKWGRLCGLTMLLPHGYEGQGPEHSSARLERYLQLCAEHNMQVCTPTTPAQIFHLLRRQALRPSRKPLVVMSPKSLLRHKDATSTLEDLANGRFECIIGDKGNLEAKKVKKVILCGGKVYYDLVAKREELGCEDTAIVRIEQLYPFPEKDLEVELAQFTNLESVVWCQEEPQNQGAWYSSQHHMRNVLNLIKPELNQKFSFAGRPASAAPASGYVSVHVEQQNRLVADAFEA